MHKLFSLFLTALALCSGLYAPSAAAHVSAEDTILYRPLYGYVDSYGNYTPYLRSCTCRDILSRQTSPCRPVSLYCMTPYGFQYFTPVQSYTPPPMYLYRDPRWHERHFHRHRHPHHRL